MCGLLTEYCPAMISTGRLAMVSSTLGIVAATVAVIGLASPASASDAISISTGRGLWGNDGYVPTLPYGTPVPASASSKLTLPSAITFTTSGDCTVETVSVGPPTQVTITATATSGMCTVTATEGLGLSSTYELPLAMGEQTANLGKAFNPNGMLAPGKKYLMGPVGLTTEQGNPVTYGVSGKKKYCSKVVKKKKVYLVTSKTSADKSCTVTATAPTTSDDYNPLNVTNTLGVFN